MNMLEAPACTDSFHKNCVDTAEELDSEKAALTQLQQTAAARKLEYSQSHRAQKQANSFGDMSICKEAILFDLTLTQQIDPVTITHTTLEQGKQDRAQESVAHSSDTTASHLRNQTATDVAFLEQSSCLKHTSSKRGEAVLDKPEPAISHVLHLSTDDFLLSPDHLPAESNVKNSSNIIISAKPAALTLPISLDSRPDSVTSLLDSLSGADDSLSSSPAPVTYSSRESILIESEDEAAQATQPLVPGFTVAPPDVQVIYLD